MLEWDIVWDNRGIILSGLWLTVWLFAVSLLGAAVLGTAIAYALERNVRPVTILLRGFIAAMRTLPFLVLAYLLYYGLPQLGVRLGAVTAGLLALTVYHSAYVAEILRGARLTLPRGGVDAAMAQGLLPATIFARIVLPQLLARSRPVLGNQAIYALKDTSFLAIITVPELTAAANAMQARYFVPFEAFIVVIALYWLVTIAIEQLVKRAGAYGAKRGFENV